MIGVADTLNPPKTENLGLFLENKLILGFFFRNGGGTYLYPARASVTMKFIEELSEAELANLWNAIVRNVNKIKITKKDIETLDDYDFDVDRVTPAVYRALDEMDVTVDNILDYDDDEYDDTYDEFYDSFVEPALLAFIERVEQSVM